MATKRKTVRYAGTDIPMPQVNVRKILTGVAVVGIGIWVYVKFGKKRTKLPTRNKPYKDPLLLNIIDSQTGKPIVSQWSPTPLAKELYTSMNGINIIRRVPTLQKLLNLVDPLKVKAVYYEYSVIANENNDKMNLVQRIRDEYIYSDVKDDVLLKLETLGLG